MKRQIWGVDDRARKLLKLAVAIKVGIQSVALFNNLLNPAFLLKPEEKILKNISWLFLLYRFSSSPLFAGFPPLRVAGRCPLSAPGGSCLPPGESFHDATIHSFSTLANTNHTTRQILFNYYLINAIFKQKTPQTKKRFTHPPTPPLISRGRSI